MAPATLTKHHRPLFSQSWRLFNVLVKSVPGETGFLAKDGTSSRCPHVAEREREREREIWLLPLLIRMLIPSWGPAFMTSSDLIIHKGPSSNTIMLHVEASAEEFWGHDLSVHKAHHIPKSVSTATASPRSLSWACSCPHLGMHKTLAGNCRGLASRDPN